MMMQEILNEAIQTPEQKLLKRIERLELLRMQVENLEQKKSLWETITHLRKQLESNKAA